LTRATRQGESTANIVSGPQRIRLPSKARRRVDRDDDGGDAPRGSRMSFAYAPRRRRTARASFS